MVLFRINEDKGFMDFFLYIDGIGKDYFIILVGGFE